MGGDPDPIFSIHAVASDVSRSPSDVSYKGHVISLNMANLSTKDKSLQKSFLSHVLEHFQRQDSPLFTETAKQEQYLLNDFMAVGRSAAALAGTNQDAQDLMAETGVSLIGTGGATWAKGKKEEEAALRALDTGLEKRAKEVQRLGKAEVLMGASIGVSRSFGLATDTTKINCGVTATTSFGQTTFALGTLSSFFSSVWYSFVGLEAWGSLKKIWALEKEIKDKSATELISFLKSKLEFKPEDTLEFLQAKYDEEIKSANNVDSEKTPLNSNPFEAWCEEILSKETEALAKDFLQTINPDASKEYDWDQAAKNMTNGLEEKVNSNGDRSIEELNLSSKALIGLESLHCNRLEMAKLELSRSIGKEALQALLDYPHSKIAEADLEKKIKDGIDEAKLTHGVLLTFAVFGLAILTASTIGSCIACPPLGLIIACIVCTVILNVIVSGVDLNALIKSWDAPIGKYEERSNTLKLLAGIGCITAICALSAGTFGAPAIIALTFISIGVITSLIRYKHAREKRATDEEIECSMKNLLAKLYNLKLENSRNGVGTQIPDETKEKMKVVLKRSLQRTHRFIKKGFDSEEIITMLGDNKIANLQAEIEKWKDAEDCIIKELRNGFETLEKAVPAAKSWMSSFQAMFVDVPHLKRIFPEESSSSSQI